MFARGGGRAVDADAKVVTVDWMWSEPGWQEDTLGDIDDLGNGRVLITEAHPDCWSPQNGLNSNIVEVDQATGEVASRLTFPNADHTTYRAERYDGCTLFASTTHCPDLAARAAALDSVLTP